jgi:hypothetical protein
MRTADPQEAAPDGPDIGSQDEDLRLHEWWRGHGEVN